jgi:hypothetical protein
MDARRRVRRPDSLIPDLLPARSRKPLKKRPPAKNMNTKSLRSLLLAFSILPLQGCVTTGATTVIGTLQAIGNAPRAVADAIVGVTQVRRQEYQQYQKHIDETNIARETKGLQPLPKLPYKDWVKGESVTPSSAQSSTSTSAATQR